MPNIDASLVRTYAAVKRGLNSDGGHALLMLLSLLTALGKLVAVVLGFL